MMGSFDRVRLALLGAAMVSAACGAPNESSGVEQALADSADAGDDGLIAPTLADIEIPPNLGRPPTSADVKVLHGFDGKTPDEVAALVRADITNAVDPSNESFVHRTAVQTFTLFTIAVNNVFVAGSPPATFVAGLVHGGARLTMLGTPSWDDPTVLMAETAGAAPRYYALAEHGVYQPMPSMPYPVLMQTPLRLDPAGVRVTYPAWSAPVLAGPTSVVIEP
jgi:hypothetical protein